MAPIMLKVILIALTARCIQSTLGGINYMDPLRDRSRRDKAGSNPCNPLYWYPKHIPDYCYSTTPGPLPPLPPPPVPLPVPVPLPIPVPLPVPLDPPMPYRRMAYPPMIPPLKPPGPLPPIAPSVPIPYGVPVQPSHPMLPVAGVPYPPPPPPYHLRTFPNQRQVGMVPGIRGIVSPDGGINVLPFSDAYSEMLNEQKNKMIRKRINRVLKDYEDYPRLKRLRHRLRHRIYSDESR